MFCFFKQFLVLKTTIGIKAFMSKVLQEILHLNCKLNIFITVDNLNC